MEDNTFNLTLLVRESRMYKINCEYLLSTMAIKINPKNIEKMYIHV